MHLLKIIDVYERDRKNPSKTYNIKHLKEFDISTVNIDDLKTITSVDEIDENVFYLRFDSRTTYAYSKNFKYYF